MPSNFDIVGALANEAPALAEGVFVDETLVKPIDLLVIRPSIDFDAIASDHITDLPPGLRRVLGAMGAGGKSGGGSLASYLLFEADFCRELIYHGYRDTMAVKDEVKRFFGLDLPAGQQIVA